MGRAPDPEQLEALRRLDAVLGELERLILKCSGAKQITTKDEARHSALVGEAQVLHGRVQSLMGSMVVQQFGRNQDSMQSVLGNATISGLFHPVRVANFWYQSLKAAQSLVKQAIGRSEEMERQGRLGLSPEVVGRYRGLITLLEWVRRMASAVLKKALFPLRALNPFVRWLEDAPVIRLLILVGAVLGAIGGIVAFLQFV